MFLGIAFMNIFLEETDTPSKYKEVNKLLNTIAKLSTKYRDDLDTELAMAYKQLEKITKGKDVEVNTLIFGIGCVFVLAETASIDKQLQDKLYKSGMKIYKDIERTESGNVAFKNANNLVRDFTNKIL